MYPINIRIWVCEWFYHHLKRLMSIVYHQTHPNDDCLYLMVMLVTLEFVLRNVLLGFVFRLDLRDVPYILSFF